LNPAELEKFMINFVVEQTGYPPEVVELDADLEADLGIDSIKKAQLFGELAEYFDVQPNENMTLDDFPTLRHVVNFLAAAPMKGDLPASAPVVAAPVISAPAAPFAKPQADGMVAAAATAVETTASPGLNPAELESFLINFVVEQTGYPPEVVELDADLEADLGIDSIKKAQLFGELAEYFDVKPDENLTLDDFPTLRHVMDFLANSGLKKNSITNAGGAADVAEAPTASAASPVTAATPVASLAPPPAAAPQAGSANATSARFNKGLVQGRAHRKTIRSLLHRLADQSDSSMPTGARQQFTHDELDELRGIAQGVGVSPSGVIAHGRAVLSSLPGSPQTSTPPPQQPVAVPIVAAPVQTGPQYDLQPENYQSDATHRFILRELELPFEPTAPAMPAWHGAALIVGEHPLGDALRRQLEAAGATVRQLPISDDLDETLASFDRIWAEQPTPHVFIVTGREPAADPHDESAWRRRWYRAAIMPYFLCQRFVQRAGEAKLLDKCSIVAATSLNGTLGFSGQITSPESGALTGLMKAIYIEVAIMREQRSMRAKAVDAPADEPLNSLAANICRELGSKEVDYEVAFIGGQRYVQCAYPVKAPANQLADIRPGGTWVITGGARGITAECARELGRRFGLKLHLIGTSPLRDVDPSWRNLSPEGMKSLKATVMREARAAGQSMEAEWSRVQRDIEIDRSLRALHDVGVQFTYHACDVADGAALAAVLDEVRRVSGPIEGIIHGAGIERSASYERKSRESVLATLGAKVDGALNLMRLTERDPIKWFVGFGSISGRLGSNGQTDYCLASDMLCKLMTWYRTRRPGVHAVGFHWHAWDEVGMAARPESASAMKLADGPTTMPKREGLEHLVREIYAGAPEGEVLVTSWEYHGRFYGAEYHPRPDGTVPEPGSIRLGSNTGEAAPSSPWEPWSFAPLVSRHELRMVDAPLPAGSPSQPAWEGSACILGQNAAGVALGDALQAAGVRVHMLPDSDNPAEMMAAMEAVYATDPPSYLFLMSGRDESHPALLDRANWQRKRARGVNVPFQTAHHWFRLRVKAKDKRPVTIVAATSLGGDLGLSGNVPSPEGGALCGMLKSIYIEDSRQTPSQARVKAIDLPADETPAGVVDAIFRELAAGDPNIEVGWSRGHRSLLQSFARPVESLVRKQSPQGGNWVITGGARGITAAVAFDLGKRYGMKLHLVGRSPAPIQNAPWRNCSEEQLNKIKSEIVRKAINESRSPEKEWERVKIDIEIFDTLNKFAAAGVHAVYHQCDLGDWDQLERVLAEIRRQDGPITGIVHGAGWANSGRFGMRNPDYFERTMSGKLDGAVGLMSLTWQDPVRYFIGFGSIGGRYGANGLSDYAAANDMLAKLCDWYRSQRPDTAVCCFHWQSWDEVGMAMLGDSSVGTKGILKMAFIPPREGVEHLCRELEAGLPTTEVLVTDRFFEKTFYPFVENENASSAAVSADATELSQLPLVEEAAPFNGGIEAKITFDPKVEPFLLDHQFRGRGLLPAVIGLESVAEAARVASGKRVTAIRDLELIEGLLFHTDQKLEARVRTSAESSGAIACELVSDFYNRSHKLIKKDRLHLRAVAEVADSAPALTVTMPEPPSSMHAFEFQHNGPLYHGPTLHGVKGTTFDEHGGWGQLAALSLSKLGGPRPGHDWTVPATLLDAGFYVCGIHVWFLANQSFSLPASLERVRFGRMPREDENCLMTFTCREMSEKQAIYDFTVFGEDRAAVLQVTGHRLVMIRS
jgi:NAD(P)-dependent dehydrogenase (short-subunit alcohol dehydrogenase family)/acyl carrier protein